MIAPTNSPDRPTLAEYFENVFLPEKLSDTTINLVYQYRTAINAFCEYTGRNILVADVTESMVDAFEPWCRANGKDSNAGKYRRHIAAVMRMARPGQFDPKPAGPPRGINPALDEGTLWHFFQTVYRPQRHAASPGGTIEDFESVIRCFYRFVERAVLVTDFSNELIAAYMEHLRGRDRTRATVNKHRRVLLALWRFAKRRKLLAEYPDVDPLRDLRRIPTAWWPDEMFRIVKSGAEHPGTITCDAGNIPAGAFWEALLRTAYNTGARVSALLTVRRDDVDLDSGFVRIDAERQKHRTDGLYKLLPETLTAIRAIWKPRRDLLFPWPYDQGVRQWKCLNTHYRRILARAGLSSGRKDLFHKLRRTTATLVTAASGIEVACRLLGHSSIQVTQGYVDPSKLPNVYAADVLPRLTGKAGAA
jgi:site-specific recombinase XerD